MEISIDSNSLSYLIEASDPDYNPDDDEKSNFLERISMLRIFLYTGLSCAILPQVYRETEDIEVNERKEIHISTLAVLFHKIQPVWTDHELANRVRILNKFHPKEKDCRLLAEAELSNIDVLLTRDKKLRNRLKEHSKVEIVFPSDFIKRLNINHGGIPMYTPHETNPLSKKSWWRI